MASIQDIMQARLRTMQQKVQEAPSSGPRKIRKADPTVRLYNNEDALWIKFKKTFGEIDLHPDLPTLMLFYQWYTADSKGKLDKRSTIGTLEWKVGRFACMYADYYHYKIPPETVDEIRNYIRTDLADELCLKDLAYAKEFADWTDVKIMIHYTIALDLHEYRQNRFRVQLVFLYLLFSASGERLGAVVRSEAYRNTNEALRYEDVKLFMKPSSNLDSAPKFAMHVTFNCRKGERLNNEEYLTLTFEQDDNDVLAHCIVLMFLTLAFLDNIFDDVATPKELYSKRNPSTGDLLLRFKPSHKPVPILRRLEGIGSLELSQTLAWSAGSVTTESQRVSRECGFPQRFTFYNIRRAVSNSIDGKISTAQKIQLMGHQDPKDKIFRRWYQSRHFTAPVEDIFKGRDPRSNKQEALSMHLRQDRDAPPKLPEDLKKQLHAADEKVQGMLELRESLRQKLRQAIESKDPLELGGVEAALKRIQRLLCARKDTITRQHYKEFRADWFEARPGEILRSQGQPGPEESSTESPASVSMPEGFRPDRQAIIDALYSKEGQTACSYLIALERLLEYCINNQGNMKMPPPKRKVQSMDEVTPVRQRKQLHRFQYEAQKEESATKRQKKDRDSKRPWTEAENKILEQYLSTLKNPSSINADNWQEILALLSNRTKTGIIFRSRELRKDSDTTSGKWTEAENLVLEEHSACLSRPSNIFNAQWQEILARLPGRTKSGIIKQFFRLRMAQSQHKAPESAADGCETSINFIQDLTEERSPSVAAVATEESCTRMQERMSLSTNG